MDLYYMAESPPCRAVLMVAEHLTIEFNLIPVDLSKGDQYQPQFTKINPFHTVPTLVDHGFVLWESRAIITYLVDNYSKGSDLYPRAVQDRAKVDQLLYQELDLYNKQSEFLRPYIQGRKPRDEDKKRFEDSLKLWDEFMTGKKYLTLGHVTLADISLLASLSFAEACEYDLEKHTNISTWKDRMKQELTYYDRVNKEPMERFTAFMQLKKSEVK